MTDRALISGDIVWKQRKIARNGVSFIALNRALDANGREARVYAFNERVAAAIEELRIGDRLSVCGRLWAGNGREPAVIVDGMLTKDGPRIPDRRDKRDQQREEASLEQQQLALL